MLKRSGHVNSPNQSSQVTHYKQLAMSILTGMDFLDGDRYGPILPVEYAKEVCRWAGYEVHN